jgi:hypothetical protein
MILTISEILVERKYENAQKLSIFKQSASAVSPENPSLLVEKIRAFFKGVKSENTNSRN